MSVRDLCGYSVPSKYIRKFLPKLDGGHNVLNLAMEMEE
jgi:hypothetical protein